MLNSSAIYFYCAQVHDKNNAILREESWKDFEEIYQEGKARAIGVSNFTVSHLESLLKSCLIVPHVNQVGQKKVWGEGGCGSHVDLKNQSSLFF